jgi:lysophospholipase L1-like esterase
MPASSAGGRSVRWGVGIALVAILAGSGLVYHRGSTRPVLPDSGGRQGRCALWFVGSSSISRWAALSQDMRPWIAHNRGVGGASIDRIRTLFRNDPQAIAPDAIVLYVGENDILAGESADQALADLNAFLVEKRGRIGATPVFVILLKPSPARAANIPRHEQFNQGIAQLAAREADIRSIDVVSPMMAGGRPERYFASDGVHLNAEGYRLWAGVIKHALKAGLPQGELATCAAADRAPG